MEHSNIMHCWRMSETGRCSKPVQCRLCLLRYFLTFVSSITLPSIPRLLSWIFLLFITNIFIICCSYLLSFCFIYLFVCFCLFVCLFVSVSGTSCFSLPITQVTSFHIRWRCDTRIFATYVFNVLTLRMPVTNLTQHILSQRPQYLSFC